MSPHWSPPNDVSHRLIQSAYVLVLLSLAAGFILLGSLVLAEKEGVLPPAPAEFATFVVSNTTWSETCAPYVDFKSESYDAEFGELTYRWTGNDPQFMECIDDPHALVGPLIRYIQPGSLSTSLPASCAAYFEAYGDEVAWNDKPIDVDEIWPSDIGQLEHYVWTGPREQYASCNNLSSLPEVVNEGEIPPAADIYGADFEFTIELFRD